jgi:hypothetical protein
MQILPADPDKFPSKLSDLCNEDKLHGAIFHDESALTGDEKQKESALAMIKNDMLEIHEYLASAGSIFEELDQSLVLLWNHRGETLVSMLKDVGKFLFEDGDLTVESIKIKALEIEYELCAWFRMPVLIKGQGYIRAMEVIDYALAHYNPEDDGQGDHASQSGVGSLSGGISMSGASAYTTTNRKGAEKQHTPSVASVIDASSVRGAGSVISLSANASDTASQMLNDKNAKHPLEILSKIIDLFKEREKKDNSSASENPWTFHIMTPKRLRYFRSKLEERFAAEHSQGNTGMFLLACRWSFSTRHDKSNRKENEDVNLSNNTLFGIEAFDCKNSIVLLGSDLFSNSSISASTTKCANISMVQLGAAPDKRSQFFDSPALQQFEQQLCNIEFVSPKNADKIRNGAQVSSIIRNFCAHLKYATDKRELNNSDLEYYIAFVRRYNSRLQEAFDVVARSCLVDGFQPGVRSDEVDSQGQLFFGSLGIVELAFSVIQVMA